MLANCQSSVAHLFCAALAYESNSVVQNYLQRELDKLIESEWGLKFDQTGPIETHAVQ